MAKPAKLKRKYLWSLYIVVVAVNLLATVGLFTLYTGSQISRATQYSTAQLEQVCASLDILYDSLSAKVKQILVNAEANTFFQSSQVDRLQEAHLGIQLRALRTSDPYLRYITLYNGTTERFVSTASAGDGRDLDADQLLTQVDVAEFACGLRAIGKDYNTQPLKEATVYTFIYPIQNRDGSTGLIILDVNDSYFNDTVNPIRLEKNEQTLALVNRQGRVISILSAQPGQATFSPSTAAQLDFESPAIQEGTGSFTYRSGSGSRFTTYALARGSGWTVYNIMPSSMVLEGIPSAMALTLALTLASLAFGFLLSRKVSSRLYAPIQALYENYVSADSQQEKGSELEQLGEAIAQAYAKADNLEQGLTAAYRESKNMYLGYLIHGEANRIRAAEATYQRLDIDLAAPSYFVALIECVPQRADVAQEANLFICYYALENIARELLATPRGMEFIRVNENRFAALVYLEDQVLEPRLQQGLETIASTMQKEFHLDTTVCVGDVVTSWENINLDYEQTRIAMDSHSASHYGKAFFARETPEAMNSELYYHAAPKKLVEYLRAGDLDACAVTFDTSLAATGQVSFKQVKTFCRHSLMSVLDSFSSYFEGNDAAFPELMEQLNRIDGCQNVRALKGVYMAFLDQMSRRLGENRRSGSQAAALSAKAYIDENYADPDLSVRVLAEKMGLSPSYMGKVFTAVTTYSFTDYLTEVRLTQAAQLLRTTKLPISKISGEVGIPNANYFYSLFKKKYGTTPSAYRKEPHE